MGLIRLPFHVILSSTVSVNRFIDNHGSLNCVVGYADKEVLLPIVSDISESEINWYKLGSGG